MKNEALFRHLERNGQGAPCQQQQEQHESREEAAAEEQAAAGEEQRQEAAAAAQQERQATEAPGRRQQQQQEPQRGSEGRLIGWALQKQRQMHLSEEDQGLLAALEPDCQLFYPPWQ